jgi:hypothetical protein
MIYIAFFISILAAVVAGISAMVCETEDNTIAAIICASGFVISAAVAIELGIAIFRNIL